MRHIQLFGRSEVELGESDIPRTISLSSYIATVPWEVAA